MTVPEGPQESSYLSGLVPEMSGGLTLNAVLRLVVDLAAEMVPGVTGATLSVVADGGPLQTATASPDWIGELDELQYRVGGPVPEAVRSGNEQTLAVGQGQYPGFEDAAAKVGVASVWSLPLVTEGKPCGGLNLYSTQADQEGDRRPALVQTLTRLAAVLLADAAAWDQAQAANTRLWAALASRGVIGQAQGVLMAREHIDAERAFDILRRASQRTNTKLRVVAAELVAHTWPRPDPAAEDHAGR